MATATDLHRLHSGHVLTLSRLRFEGHGAFPAPGLSVCGAQCCRDGIFQSLGSAMSDTCSIAKPASNKWVVPWCRRSMPSVTGPAPPSDRARPNWISRSRSSTPNLQSPSFARSIASVAAFDGCGGLPTAAMSSICKSTRSANLVKRAIRALTGVSLRSTASSATKGRRSASSRREVRLTHMSRPLRRTWARHEPDGSFAMVGNPCATRRRSVAKTVEVWRGNGGWLSGVTV